MTATAPQGSATSRRDDADLAARACAGDESAFADLYTRYSRLVSSVVRAEIRRGPAAPDADDVVQEVFTLAWQRLDGLRDPASFRPWLLQIARRAVIDHARRTNRRPALDTDDELVLGRTADAAPGPDEVTELMELSAQLRGALDGLSRRDATAITLAAQFGFGPAEIGEALGITPNNAKVVLHRARARLKALID